VRLAPRDGGTAVSLESDVALGGMLGSVGQKVVAKQAGKVTSEFAEALRGRLSGAPLPPAGVAPAPASAPRWTAPAAAPAPASDRHAPADWLRGRVAVPVPVVAGTIVVLTALVARSLGRRGR
jgi:uncharacterized protein